MVVIGPVGIRRKMMDTGSIYTRFKKMHRSALYLSTHTGSDFFLPVVEVLLIYRECRVILNPTDIR